MNKSAMNNSRTLRFVTLSSRSASAMLAIALVVLFTSIAVFASTPQGTFEKTLTVDGPVNLEVLTRSGDVTVRAGSSGSILIRGKIYVGNRWLGANRDAEVHQIEQHSPIRQEGNNINVDHIDNDIKNTPVNYEISVPADTVV